MIAIKFIALCAAFMQAIAAYAQDFSPPVWQPTTVGIHIASAHSERGFNNTNFGLYARWAAPDASGWAAGAYYNSERAASAWAGYTWSHRSQAAPISIGFTAGAVSGYRSAKILPLAVPSAALHFGSQAIRMTAIPKIEKRGASALHLSYEVKL